MVNFIYWLYKLVVRILILILPVEFINRLFYFMPSRLIVDVLKWYGAEIGENVKIMFPFLLHNWQDNSPKPCQNLFIGNNITIGRNAFFDLHGKIHIESNCTIAMNVMILTHTNVGDLPIQEDIPENIGSVTIHSGVYIGARSMLVASVDVGENSAVGAGSVVIRDVPANCLYAGVPAKIIRTLGQYQKFSVGNKNEL